MFDPGLQPERTDLAWRRTVLGLAVASSVALRVLPPALGRWSVLVGVLGLAATVTIAGLAVRRSRRVQRFLVAGRGSMPGGILLFAVALLATLGAAIAVLSASIMIWKS